MVINELEISQQMDQILQLFRDDIATIRTGRATPALIEAIEVLVYAGAQKMKLQELGTITIEGARSLVFIPWDKLIISEIKNGILKSGVGYTPLVENDRIRINLPLLTAEERENYVKLLGKKLEGARVMIRDARGRERYRLQEGLKKKEMGEDEYHVREGQLQKITDEHIAKLEGTAKLKEAEIRGE